MTNVLTIKKNDALTLISVKTCIFSKNQHFRRDDRNIIQLLVTIYIYISLLLFDTKSLGEKKKKISNGLSMMPVDVYLSFLFLSSSSFLPLNKKFKCCQQLID